MDGVNGGTVDPYRIRLTHWDGHYAGDYFWNTGKLRLHFRGSFIEYPLQKLIEKAQRASEMAKAQGEAQGQ